MRQITGAGWGGGREAAIYSGLNRRSSRIPASLYIRSSGSIAVETKQPFRRKAMIPGFEGRASICGRV